MKSLTWMALHLQPNRTQKWSKSSTDTCHKSWTSRLNFKEKWANSTRNSTASKTPSRNTPKTKSTSKWSSLSTKIKLNGPRMWTLYSAPKSTNSTLRLMSPLRLSSILSKRGSNSSSKHKATKTFSPKTQTYSSNSSKAAKPTNPLPKTTQGKI